jgi:hypothetical protein
LPISTHTCWFHVHERVTACPGASVWWMMYWAHSALNGTADHTTVPDPFVTVADTQARMSTAHERRETLTTLVETLTGAPRG